MITPRVFISHSSSDKKAFVKRLATELRRSGAEVFYDDWSIKPGDRLREKVSSGIRDCTHFLVVLSVRSVQSEWVKRELDEALILEIQGRGPKVIHVLIGRLTVDLIPADLLGLLWVDFRPRGSKQYQAALDKLRFALGLEPSSSMGESLAPDEIRTNLLKFLELGQLGRLDEGDFWDFWTRPMARANWLSLLRVSAELVRQGVDERSIFALDVLLGVLTKHEIAVKRPPRLLLELLSSSDYDDPVSAKLLQIALALKTKVPPQLVSSYLRSRSSMKVYAICEYIEYGGVRIDDDIAEQLLIIVESDDDEAFYFEAFDKEGTQVTVDAREQAARCLMLADTEELERDAIVRRVKKYYPEIVADSFSIALNAMLLGGIYDLPRQTIPINLDPDERTSR